MEDVLEVYHLPYDLGYPVVCMDESSKQLIGEVREPAPCAPGRPARMDNEYVRNGVAEILMNGKTGNRVVISGIYKCKEHPDANKNFTKGGVFPPCGRAGSNGTTWILVRKFP